MISGRPACVGRLLGLLVSAVQAHICQSGNAIASEPTSQCTERNGTPIAAFQD